MLDGACFSRAFTEWNPKSSMSNPCSALLARWLAAARLLEAAAAARAGGVPARLARRLGLPNRRALASCGLAPDGRVGALAVRGRWRVVCAIARAALSRRRLVDQPEVDAPPFQVDPRNLHVDL